MAPPGRILIAHPDPSARAQMRGLAERRLRRADTIEVDSFDSLLAQLGEGPGIELVIVDLDLPGMSGEVGLRLLAARHRGVRVAALFSSTGEDEVERRATQGAAAVPKPLFEASVVETLGLMLAGASDGQDAAVTTNLPDVPTNAQPAMADPKLTSRQREALLLVSQGHSNREIARILGIAKGTVKVHVNAAFRCLGVHNRVNAAAAFRKYFEIH